MPSFKHLKILDKNVWSMSDGISIVVSPICAVITETVATTSLLSIVGNTSTHEVTSSESTTEIFTIS